MTQLSVTPNPKVTYDVLYEDEDILLVNKPSKVVTQPGVGHDRDALLNGLFVSWGKSLQNLGKKRDYGLLHRLDRGTSGVVVIGLSIAGYEGMRALFHERGLIKNYCALVHGLAPREGRCDARIDERRVRGNKRAIVLPRKTSHRRGSTRALGQEALTLYRTLAQGALSQTSTADEHASLIRCQIHTGRLHQIRAHMSAIGHPVIGDFDYGALTPLNRSFRARSRGRLALHALSLSFIHPLTRVQMNISAPIPDHFLQFCDVLGIEPDRHDLEV